MSENSESIYEQIRNIVMEEIKDKQKASQRKAARTRDRNGSANGPQRYGEKYPDIANMMKKLWGEGMSYNKIRAYMEEQGIPSPQGKKNWNIASIRVIINPELRKYRPGQQKGETCQRAILSDEDVYEIKTILSGWDRKSSKYALHNGFRTIREIAAYYGIHETTIQSIKRGDSWKHIVI